MIAILSAKDAKAKEKNIIIQYEGIMPSELISDADIVVVLSNVVDNAIEACEKVVGERKIKIKSVLTKSIWILYTENPSIKTHIGNINKIQTSKSDKRIHGFGLQNIERTAKKYNGEMSIKYNNGVFKSKIVFMLDKRGNNDKNSNM